MDRESTQLKSGTEAHLPVPLSQDQNADVYQRALTLMAGETPGSGGEVRVWAPEAWRMCLTLISVCSLATLGFAALVLLIVGHLSVNLFLDFTVLISVFFMLPTLYHCSQSGSVSADENGVAFRDLFGASKIRYSTWVDVHSLYVDRYYLYGFSCLVLDGSAESRLNLIGYTKTAQAEIKDFITGRAGLRPSPLNPSTLVCATAPLPWPTRLPLTNGSLSPLVATAEGDVKDAATEKSLLPLRRPSAGELQIWSPSRARLLWPQLPALMFTVLLLGHPESGALYFLYSFDIAGCLWLTTRLIRRPRHLTANQESLGVVTEKGFHVIPWSSIQSARSVTAMGVIHSLRLKATDRLIIPMSAFPATERNRVLQEIASRSQLKPDDTQSGQWIR